MPSGGHLFVSASGKPVFDDAGGFVGYHGTARDETVIVQARRRAEQAQALLRNAIESIAEGFAIYDDAERLVMSNASYRELFFGDSECRPGSRAQLEEVLRQGVAKGNSLMPMAVKKNGVPSNCVSTAIPKVRSNTDCAMAVGRW